MKKEKQKLIGAFANVSPAAKMLNDMLEEKFEHMRTGFVARRTLTELSKILEPKKVIWHGAEVLTLASWRSDISPKLQLVNLQGKLFFGYTACGGLAPLDGATLEHFKIRQTIDEFLTYPIGFFRNIATQK